MTTARDELVDVFAEALYDARGYAGCSKEETHETRNVWKACQADAQATLAALVERYGEPKFYTLEPGERIISDYHPDEGSEPFRRLVFPWQAVGESA